MRRIIEDGPVEKADVAILPRSSSVMMTTNPRDKVERVNTGSLRYLEANRKDNALVFDKHRILPNGIDNNSPINFKELLDRVYLGHGVKRTLINLLLSGGVGLYQEVKEGRNIVRDWMLDDEITDWLDSWEFFDNYLIEAATDMVYVENNYPAFTLNRGFTRNLGYAPKIAKLELYNAEEIRVDVPVNRKHNNVFYADWMLSSLNTANIKPIPVFDRSNPYKHDHACMFLKMATFGSSGYGRPPDIGAVQMLEVLSLLPNFHRANLTEKGLKWIIAVSEDLYDSICKEKGWSPESKEFKKWQQAFTDKIDEFLYAPNAEKVQTRLITTFAVDRHTAKAIDAIRITKLDDDTKTLSEVGLQLHDTYTIGYVSATSINPQLANVHLKNHALSGSNLQEAYEMHIRTSTPTMRNLILYPVNLAIKLNFPNKKLKVGFMDLAFTEDTKKKAKKEKQEAEQ